VVGALAETTLSCEFQHPQQQRQQHHHFDHNDDDDDDDDGDSCDDDDELCYNGALNDVDHGGGPVDVPMSRPLVAVDRRRLPGSAAGQVPSDPASSARTHCCFNQHVIANR